MEKLICSIVKNYRKMMDYWMTITKCGFKRAAIALMAPVIIEIFVMGFNKEVAAKVGLLSMVILGLLWLLMYLDSGTKLVHFISKGKYDNPRQLLQNMTHLSYVYGIIISVNVEYIIIFLAFSFFYFAFHLYINPEKLETSYIKQRLQLYMVLGTTVSFILLLVNENGGIKIFITGILLDYLWINYFITDKENNLKNKDKCLK